MHTLWQFSMEKVAATALSAQAAKHKAELKLRKQQHAARIKALKAKHKKQLATVKAKERAKAKVQRAITAVPILGIAALSLIEKHEFDEWSEENPGQSFETYSLEISEDINTLLNDEYQSWQAQLATQ